MENLLPREAYDIDETGYWKRMRLFLFIGYGVPFGASMSIVFSLILHRGMFEAVIVFFAIGGVGGLFFSILFPFRFRRKMSAFLNALYRGDRKIDVPPPATKNLKYRLVCNWMKSDNFAVGGVLYIGKGLLMFIPHKKNLPQHREPFEITPLNDLTLGLVESKPNWFSKLLIPNPPSFVEIKWLESSARFLVPKPLETLSEIERKIAFLKG